MTVQLTSGGAVRTLNGLPRLLNIGAGSGPGAGVLTATAIPTYRVFQRDTTTGNPTGFSTIAGQGYGAVPVTLSASTTQSGITLKARMRALGTTYTVPGTLLQDWVTVPGVTAIATTGTTFNLTLPSLPSAFILDMALSTDLANGVTVAPRMSVGEVFYLTGQSLASAMVDPRPGDTTTLATLGIVPSVNSSCFVAAAGTNDFTNSYVWGLPADGISTAQYRGAFGAQFLKSMEAALGCPCALVGYTYGAQPLAWFAPSGGGNAKLTEVANSVGKWGTTLLNHGHSDVWNGTSRAAYLSTLNSLMSDLDSKNAFAGTKRKILMPVPNYNGDSRAIRFAMQDYAAVGANNATEIIPVDIALMSDGIHQSQYGNVDLARHFTRAAKKNFGLDTFGDAGPAMTSVTRSGATLTVTVTHAGGTALSAIGNWWTRFEVYPTGTLTGGSTISSGTVTSATTFTLTLSAAPTGAVDLWHSNIDGTPTGGSSWMVFDNNTAGGLSLGRSLQASLAPVTSN